MVPPFQKRILLASIEKCGGCLVVVMMTFLSLLFHASVSFPFLSLLSRHAPRGMKMDGMIPVVHVPSWCRVSGMMIMISLWSYRVGSKCMTVYSRNFAFDLHVRQLFLLTDLGNMTEFDMFGR
ncbi:hypothetical protein B0J11DRAFT_323038 [Dendryphion nanum]|uniref:Uncharacterized protein n=1 Tax=Dendryphion nanum TaxID=256645 RepID=A0A9P9IKN0_9PLEO|nr:hypothetical protein B0J11DRAFT_323038 [Dendryphion nanum]